LEKFGLVELGILQRSLLVSRPTMPLPNEQPSTLRIDILQCIQQRDFETESPYQVFLNGQKKLIVMAYRDVDDVTNIQLLTLGLSSLIEHYFRSVISKSIFLCRQSLDGALKSAQVSLAAANYYRGENLGRAILDNVNFSDEKIISEQTFECLKINLKNSDDGVKTALSDIQQIFILRHAVVHANGFLSPKNLIEIKADLDKPTAVSTTHVSFENMVEVALNSIRAYNTFIYQCLLKRAQLKGYIKFDDTPEDSRAFKKYWDSFIGSDSADVSEPIEAIYKKAKDHFTY
jgi:hypothetical protein